MQKISRRQKVFLLKMGFSFKKEKLQCKRKLKNGKENKNSKIFLI